MSSALTDQEHALLAQKSWTVDELITLVFVLRRVVAGDIRGPR
jgi:hypothetical protein